MKRRVVAGLLAGGLALVAAAGPAAAGGPTRSYYFYDCSGPGPDSFWAVKTGTPAVSGALVSAASAFRVEDSTDLFTVFDFSFGEPGNSEVSSAATTWCSVDILGLGTVQFGGNYSPG